jgi:hypothetical protein
MLYDLIGLLVEDDITYYSFQQDGASAHKANRSMIILYEIFGERVISRILWPPSLSDSTLLSVAAKSVAYFIRPRTFHELKTAITVFIRDNSQADLQKVFANKIKRVQTRIDARGQHFQNQL